MRKFFKRVGKGIKKAFKKIGKFVGKMGILGQIGMMMFLPMIGGFLMKGLGNVAGSLLASNTGIMQGMGHLLKGAHSFVQGGINAFRTVSEGVTSFVSQFTKTAASKLGFNVTDAAPNFFGTGGAWERVQSGIVQNAKSIFDPFRSNLTITQGMQDSLTGNKTNIDIVSRNTGISKDMLTRLNPDSTFQLGDVINVDMGTLKPIPNGEIVTGLDNISPKTKNEIDYYDKQIADNKERLSTSKTLVDIPEMPVGSDGKPIPGFNREMGFKTETFVKDPNALKMPLKSDGSPVEGFNTNMGFNKNNVEVKTSSILDPKPLNVEVKTPKVPSADAYELSGQVINEAKGNKNIAGNYMDRFANAPLRTFAETTSTIEALTRNEPEDYSSPSSIVQAQSADPVGNFGATDFFGSGMRDYSLSEQTHMSMGTASLFNNKDDWVDWMNKSFSGQSR